MGCLAAFTLQPAPLAGEHPYLCNKKGRPSGRLSSWRRGRDSNPRKLLHFAGFQDRYLQPLGHLSIALSYFTRYQGWMSNGCLAATATQTWRAPAAASASDAYRTVAPVVVTSSTKRYGMAGSSVWEQVNAAAACFRRTDFVAPRCTVVPRRDKSEEYVSRRLFATSRASRAAWS